MRVLILAALVTAACTSAAATGGDATSAPDAVPALVGSPAPVWPARGALRTSTTTARAPRRRHVIAIDAGHGAPGNTGAISVTCQDEQDFTLRLSRAVIAQLRDRVTVIETRPAGRFPAYPARVEAAQKAGAEAIVSFHFDVRGDAVVRTTTTAGRPCFESAGSTGFAVLWSDEGAEPQLTRRHAIAQALARALTRRGFGAYDGVDYPGLYEGDAVPGVFVDRHEPQKRVYMLRRPPIPTVILETHQAIHREEWARWQEPETVAALVDALVEMLDDEAAFPLPPPLAR